MVLNSAVLAHKTAAVLAYSSAAIDVMATGHRSFQCSVTKSGSTMQHAASCCSILVCTLTDLRCLAQVLNGCRWWQAFLPGYHEQALAAICS